MIFSLLTVAFSALAQSGAPVAAPSPAKPPAPVIAQPGTLRAGAVAKIVDGAGKTIGGAYFYEGPSGVLLRIEASGLKPGWHGMHLHEKGACEGPGFQSAGAHINPGKKPHGLLHPQGPDAGDLPSFYVETSGLGRGSLFSPLVSLRGAGGRPALLDADGSTLVIHAAPDDQSTQPIGGSGDRVACGVIKAPAAK